MKKYDIYWANLPGEGTDTTVIYGTRPVIIVSNDANNEYAPFVTVVPLTSNLFKKALPTHVFITGQGLKTSGLALCEQIITLDKNQLSAQIGFLTKEWDKLAVEHAVQVQLGMVEA